MSTDTSKRTQVFALIELFEQQGAAGLTPLDALRLVGSMRLGARVWDLKKLGYTFQTDRITLANGKKVARYVMTGRPSFPEAGDRVLVKDQSADSHLTDGVYVAGAVETTGGTGPVGAVPLIGCPKCGKPLTVLQTFSGGFVLGQCSTHGRVQARQR